ncbi:MAG: glycoside hydrolase family 65 protein [Alphaproteobacteria bacterium]|nr:glycoside hydrolase family 65 protein [Alphaproteobacteria bacterium]
MTARQTLPRLLDLPVAPTTDPAWILVEEGFTLAREHEVESLFAIGNGYAGSRASLAEGCALSAPATCVAGVFVSAAGSVPELARLADWTHLSVTVEGHALQLDQNSYVEHRRILDLRQAMLWRGWRQRSAGGRITRLRELRLASLADRHLLLQSMTLTAEDYSGSVSIDATPMGPLTQLTDAGITVIMAVRTRLTGPEGGAVGTAALPIEQLNFDINRGETYRLDRVVAVYTSRDTREPLRTARRRVERAVENIEDVVVQHRDAWLARWEASDLRIDGDPAAQRALRFAAYHLSSAANPDDDRVSIGARGLSGTAYKGHVFWDTDIFMLPFFNLTYPEAARALVMYRYHTLAGARAKAARLGHSGALYAWESTDSGEEVTPPFVVGPDGEVVRILTGEQEQHISADVAFAVWKYWEATGDERFLIDAGAEILIETARFWESRAKREGDGRCHIRGVVGPDEYHETVDDNAYTNAMAQWNLEVAELTARLFAERWPAQWRALSRRLGLASGEPQRWQRVARDLYTGFDERTGLFEQFQGYFGLEEIDLAAYAQRTAPMDVLLGRERIQRSKIIKQPDVVMLVFLLWERLSPQVRRVNFEYYEPRCGHGSSLSPAIHALVAARLGNTALAEHYFRQAAEIDLADNMGNAAGGIHAAGMGGLWQAAVFGFAGLRLTEKAPEHCAKLPPSWHSFCARFQWRGQWHELTLPEG